MPPAAKTARNNMEHMERGLSSAHRTAQRPATSTSRERPRRAGEHQRVEQVLRRRHAEQAGVFGVEHQQVGARARRKPQRPNPAARPPPASSALEQTRRGRRLAARGRGGRRCAGAAPGAGRIRASAVPRPGARDLAVRADRQRHAARPASAAGRPGRRRGWLRWSGRARRRRRCAATASISAGVACVACTSCQRASSALCARQPFDRPRAGGGQAVVDLGGLLGDVDVDRHRRRCRARRSAAIDAGRARRAANGSPRRRSVRRGRCRACALQRQHAVARRWRSGAGRRAARLRRSRRARTAPAAWSGRCRRRRPHRPAPRPASAGRRRAGRRGACCR